MNNQKIEKILESLDGTSPAAAPHFFYTRLSAKMMREQNADLQAKAWYLKPAFALAAIFLLLAINVAVLLQNNNSNSSSITSADNDSIQTLAADYSIDDANYQYDYALEK
jgi:hypothetical protein